MNVNKYVAAVGGAFVGAGVTLMAQKMRKDASLLDKTEVAEKNDLGASKLVEAWENVKARETPPSPLLEPKENVAYRKAVEENVAPNDKNVTGIKSAKQTRVNPTGAKPNLVSVEKTEATDK